MNAPGDIVILLVLIAAFVACAAYAAGRLHQRYQNGPDRAEAYRSGYDTGTRSVFSMAARAAGRRRTSGAVHASAAAPVGGEEPTEALDEGPTAALDEGPTKPVPQLGVPEQQKPVEEKRGRHLVPDELVRATTYRLPPDRVARAKVVQPADPPVPRPRGN
ncbi:hypothetical protein [Actinoplanes sp. GCM10030250]|uniref:hypothetical protein n=1 Tax=Actinoplanes sp. GCM10030250 TaxID=3273376 RepID=UPI00360A8DBD